MRATALAIGAAALAAGFAITQYTGRTSALLCTATDGDSLRCGSERIRLRGIDAPELRQPGGAAAHSALAKLATGPLVCSDRGTDRYGRTLARCGNAITPDLGRAMVLQGFAISYYDYKEEEAFARSARRGVWSDPQFIRPQDWRRGVR